MSTSEQPVIEPFEYPSLIGGLGQWECREFLAEQVMLSGLLQRPEDVPSGPDRTFEENLPLWDAILKESLRANVVITLKNFLISEWIPRSPGLYYTPDAERSRLAARDCLVKSPAVGNLQGVDDASRLLAENDAYSHPGEPDHMWVYAPGGKINMLRGGVGCVRLRDQEVDDGRVWFMSASSTFVAHEGFPVALPDELYQRCIDQIAIEGVLRATLTGRLRFMPEMLLPMFNCIVSVPQLYLLIEQVVPSPQKVENNATPQVSVPVSFLSEFEGSQKFYASYVTFFPGIKGSLRERADWLDQTYVQGMYSGRIVTDFDEQMSRFKNATFSLKNIMTNELVESEVKQVVETLHFHGDVTLMVESLNQLFAERIERMSQDKIITIGDGTTITAPVFIADAMENCFNTISSSNLDKEIKDALGNLAKEMNDLARNDSISKDQVSAMARDVESLATEATSASPRKNTLERLMDDLKNSAEAVGEAGKAVLATIVTLSSLAARLSSG